MFRTVFDLRTGTQKQIDLTEQELADLQSAPQPILPVRTIDKRRLKLALNQLGLLDTVEAAISTLDEAASINWEDATDIKEDHPLVERLVSDLKLDINVIFDLANTFT